MKKKPAFKLDIASPCSESWNEMIPVEGGRFCDNCTKTIVDFSTWTDKEIVQYVRNNQSTCGRFHNSQLNRDLLHLEKERANSFIPALLVSTALATGIASNAAAGTKTELSTPLSEQVDTIPARTLIDTPLVAEDSMPAAIAEKVTLNTKLFPRGWSYARKPILTELLEMERERDKSARTDYNTRLGKKRMLELGIMVDPVPQRKEQHIASMRMGVFTTASIDTEKYPQEDIYDIMGTNVSGRKDAPSLFNSVKYDGKIWPPKNEIDEQIKVELKPLDMPAFKPLPSSSDKQDH
ncbi:hypothetical protein [Chitinophaga pinensis]|uniref:Uncharacterized protein n=1 Tax=Chitinophaga pinensis TaxID=79329 RepID=A0A5C6LWZ0_9BACT|nr:hypothetical protein [Chitinophaga pinensis]TWW01773.1 hypothetical protein FEF09_04215 [Chitinophaga pinensis]